MPFLRRAPALDARRQLGLQLRQPAGAGGGPVAYARQTRVRPLGRLPGGGGPGQVGGGLGRGGGQLGIGEGGGDGGVLVVEPPQGLRLALPLGGAAVGGLGPTL
ncbi:hypothetical protein [Nonomuraea wenchangensis]|uniref:hypothetical protein n=1 Tax=Nonomuraea wenchangensis TaxID=568860 RepID=UPI003D9E0833